MPMKLRYKFAIILALIATLMSLFRTFKSATTRPLQAFVFKPSVTRAMHIQSIPMWEGSGNNYAYLVSDEATKDAVIIDPANAKEVLPILERELKARGLNLKSIINTHHHHDHAGGNQEMLKHHNHPIIGGKDCAHVTTTPAHKSTFPLSTNIQITALHTPCHTQDSICYLFTSSGPSAPTTSTARANATTDTSTTVPSKPSPPYHAVFTGDTLFTGGCGRFFEGSAAEMHTALNGVLAALPDDTAVFPGHEYTKGNVKFGATVLRNDAMEKLQGYVAQHKETQGRFTIADEKAFNVFMRLEDPVVQKATGKTDPIEVMATLREMKNSM